MNGFKAMFCIGLISILNCQEDPHSVSAPTSATHALDEQKTLNEDEGPKKQVSPSSTMKPILPAKRVPIVGGCSLSCSTPQKAVTNFLAALLQSPEIPFSEDHKPKTNPALFLDSHGLRVNAQHIAAAWHTLWTEGRFKDRLKDVLGWLRKFRSPLEDVLKETDSSTLIQEGLSANPNKPYSFLFMGPGLDRPWVLSTHKRGIEWLINSIEHSL